MKAVLIGTRAYKADHVDTDLICDQEFADKLSGCAQLQGHKGRVYYVHGEFEATVPHEGSAYELLLKDADTYAPYDGVVDAPGHGRVEVAVASIPTLIALKKAHLILPRKWKHHIAEYRALKQAIGVEYFTTTLAKALGDEYSTLYKLHRKECLEIAKAHPVLKQQKDTFFGSTNKELEKAYEVFDHDSIHRAIALGDVPAYTLMLDGEVWCSRKKWREMTQEQRFNCVVEEAAILALERSIIPALYLGKVFRGAEWAFETALFKICTTITSGFFRDYCIERYWDAVENRPDFVGAFFQGLRNGTVEVVNKEVVLSE